MKYQYRKQKGFSVLAIILVIVAAIVAIGVWSLSGQTNLSSANNSTLDIAISGLLADADNIKNSVDMTLIQKGRVYPITSGSFTYERPPINPKLIRVGANSDEGQWSINSNNFYATNIAGDNNNIDVALMAGGLTDIACKSINLKINGTTILPVITDYSSSANALKTVFGIKDYTFNYFNLPAIAGTSGWSRGCLSVRNIPDNNIFFFVLIAN